MKKILLSVAFVATSFLSVNAQVSVLDGKIANDANSTSFYKGSTTVIGAYISADDQTSDYTTTLDFGADPVHECEMSVETVLDSDVSQQFTLAGASVQPLHDGTYDRVGLNVKVVEIIGSEANLDLGVLTGFSSRYTNSSFDLTTINDGAWHTVFWNLEDAEWSGKWSDGLTPDGKLTTKYVLINSGANVGDKVHVIIDNIGYYEPNPLSEVGVDLAKVSAYPNPMVNTLNLEFSKAVTSVTIYSAIGSVVYSTEVPSEKLSIDTQAWNAGMYFVSVKEGSSTQTLKVIK